MFKSFNKHGAILLLSGILLFVVASSSWSSYSSAQYYPLPDGAYWNYIADDYYNYGTWVVGGTTYINGWPTKQLADSEGMSLFLSNDTSGIRQHREEVPYGYVGTYNPPLPIAKATANIGDKLVSSGTVDLYIWSIGSDLLNYQSTATVLAAEQLTVPFGTFPTIRLSLRVRMFGNFQGIPIDEVVTVFYWLAPGIGVVQQQGVGGATAQLVGTNITELFDDDGDGIPDALDNCPSVENPDQSNFDGDGQGDACDTDDDNDGVPDTNDAFPLNPNESRDSDNDGIGDNADQDDDNDGIPDAYELQMGFDPLDSADAVADADGDGETNLEEYLNGTDPRNPASNMAARRRAAIQAINPILMEED